MTDKELIRRALMGDKKAQRKCTVAGIVLTCPLCGGKASVQKDISGKEKYHVVCNNVKNACNLVSGLPIWSESAEEAIAEWNTRPGPPIGRCKDCFQYHSEGPGVGYCSLDDQGREETNFCSEFELKEG